MFLKNETKSEILSSILSSPFFENLFSEGKIMNFLNSIWDLGIMSSTDPRFNNLYGDINQHIVNNDDWTLETLFLDKLSLYQDDTKFQIFIEETVNPEFNHSEKEIKNLVDKVNESLFKDGFELAIYDYNKEGLPIYSIILKTEPQMSNKFTLNTTQFFVEANPSGNSNRFDSHKSPKSRPAFMLVTNDWDDFGVHTDFDLFYYTEQNAEYIGVVKILNKVEKKYESNKIYYKTIDYISNEFVNLNDDFCSLGQSEKYYTKIKRLFPDKYNSIFWALKDCSIFSDIEDKYSNHPQFFSLIRENEAERLLREEKYIIEGQNIETKYQFTYQFKPKYSEDNVSIDFKFDRNSLLANRSYAIIGQNGVGKTQFITSLPLDLSNEKKDSFSPHIPLFSKIIAVSYSYFDHFEIPKKTASFNYVYCGLSKEEKGQREDLSERSLIRRLHKSCKQIQKQGRTESLRKVLSNCFEKDLIAELFKIEETENGPKLIILEKSLSFVCNKISSGQSALLYIFSEVIANIRYDSLLLFDEPETHLHPNAISNLINAIFEMLDEFQSYCIITTHSPLIIREMLSKSVYIMERSGNLPSMRKIGIESFGENLTILTEEIFGNKEVAKYYKKTITKLIKEGYFYQEILNILKTDNLPLSLNASIYIKNLIDLKNEKHSSI